MYRFIHDLRARAVARTLATTTFCEGCGGVCTPGCRHEALVERRHEDARQVALYLR